MHIWQGLSGEGEGAPSLTLVILFLNLFAGICFSPTSVVCWLTAMHRTGTYYNDKNVAILVIGLVNIVIICAWR